MGSMSTCLPVHLGVTAPVYFKKNLCVNHGVFFNIYFCKHVRHQINQFNNNNKKKFNPCQVPLTQPKSPSPTLPDSNSRRQSLLVTLEDGTTTEIQVSITVCVKI